MKHLIPLYREKELYTVFYDRRENKLVKLPHRKKTYIVYVALFLVVLHGTPYVTDLYGSLQYGLLRFIVLLVIIGITYFVTYTTYSRYYVWDEVSPVFGHVLNLEKIVLEGRKQLRLESLVCCILMFVTLVFVFIFLLTQDIVWFIFTNLFFAPCLVYLFMRPIERARLLRDQARFKDNV